MFHPRSIIHAGAWRAAADAPAAGLSGRRGAGVARGRRRHGRRSAAACGARLAAGARQRMRAAWCRVRGSMYGRARAGAPRAPCSGSWPCRAWQPGVPRGCCAGGAAARDVCGCAGDRGAWGTGGVAAQGCAHPLGRQRRAAQQPAQARSRRPRRRPWAYPQP